MALGCIATHSVRLVRVAHHQQTNKQQTDTQWGHPHTHHRELPATKGACEAHKARGVGRGGDVDDCVLVTKIVLLARGERRRLELLFDGSKVLDVARRGVGRADVGRQAAALCDERRGAVWVLLRIGEGAAGVEAAVHAERELNAHVRVSGDPAAEVARNNVDKG